MKKALNALFTNNVLLFLSVAITTLLSVFIVFLVPTVSGKILFAMIAFGCIAILISYNRHDKNMMKGMLGFELAVLVLQTIIFVDYAPSTLDVVFTYGVAALFIILTLSHFGINASRRSSPKRIFFNQILFFLATAAIILWAVFSATEDKVYNVMSSVCMITQAFLVVSIESKLEVFKARREEDGWVDDDERTDEAAK